MNNNRTSSFWAVMLAVFSGNFLAILSTTSVNVALPVFMKDFQAELSSVQWIIAGFMLSTGVIAPVIGYLGDRFSYKKLYIFAIGGFTLFSGLCAAAWNIESLIVFRILQGVFSGIIMPTTMTIIYQVVKAERQAFAMSLWTLSAMIGPAIGPTFGGWLTEFFGWRSLFLMNLPIGLLAIGIVSRTIPSYRLSQGKTFDGIGFFSALIGTASLLVAFGEGNHWGWISWQTLSLLIGGALLLGFFIRWELSVKNPLLRLSLFKNARFTYSLIINCTIAISLYAGVLLTPIFLQSVQKASALDTGLVMLPGSLLMALMTPVTGKLYERIGPFWLVLIGILLIGGATWELSLLDIHATHGQVSFWLALRYLGVALSYMPVTNAGMAVIPIEYSGHGSAIINWVRQGIASLSIGVFSALLAARTAAHSLALPGMDLVQAMGLAIQDVFVVGTVVALVAAPLVFLLRKPEPQVRANS